MEEQCDDDAASEHTLVAGVTYKQVETVIEANREVLGLLPERSQAFDKDDDRLLDMAERLGGPPPEGKKEAWGVTYWYWASLH